MSGSTCGYVLHFFEDRSNRKARLPDQSGRRAFLVPIFCIRYLAARLFPLKKHRHLDTIGIKMAVLFSWVASCAAAKELLKIAQAFRLALPGHFTGLRRADIGPAGAGEDRILLLHITAFKEGAFGRVKVLVVPGECYSYRTVATHTALPVLTLATQLVFLAYVRYRHGHELKIVSTIEQLVQRRCLHIAEADAPVCKGT